METTKSLKEIIDQFITRDYPEYIGKQIWITGNDLYAKNEKNETVWLGEIDEILAIMA